MRSMQHTIVFARSGNELLVARLHLRRPAH